MQHCRAHSDSLRVSLRLRTLNKQPAIHTPWSPGLRVNGSRTTMLDLNKTAPLSSVCLQGYRTCFHEMLQPICLTQIRHCLFVRRSISAKNTNATRLIHQESFIASHSLLERYRNQAHKDTSTSHASLTVRQDTGSWHGRQRRASSHVDLSNARTDGTHVAIERKHSDCANQRTATTSIRAAQ